jgi:pectate lyase
MPMVSGGFRVVWTVSTAAAMAVTLLFLPFKAAAAPLADIVPSSLTLGAATLNSGATTRLQLTVSNLGRGTAHSVVVTISTAAAGTASRAASINVGTLPPGASGKVATTLTAPTLPGTYTVIATATTAGREVSTANNTTTTRLAVASSSASGSPLLSSAAASTTSAGTATVSCTKYQSFFDAVFTANKDYLDRIAANGDGPTYATLRYALDGLVAMAFGTREPKYLEQALRWAETIMSKATLVDYKGYRNWTGRWSSAYASAPIAYHVEDLVIGAALSEAARLVLLDPSWAATYGTRATAIRNFVAKHVVAKHLVARADRASYERLSVSTTGGLSKNAPLLLRVIVNLSEIGVTTELDWAETIVANWKHYHFQPWGTDAVIWDLKRSVAALPGYSSDVSTASPMPYYFVRAIEAGLEPPLIRTQLSNLLLGSIWNKSVTDPRFTNFIDGVNDPASGHEAWELGIVYHGWVTLGAYDPDVQAVMEGVLKALIKGQHNPSLDSMNNVWGRLELAGHITRNLRIAGACALIATATTASTVNSTTTPTQTSSTPTSSSTAPTSSSTTSSSSTTPTSSTTTSASSTTSSSPTVKSGPVPAFPGAQGYGAMTLSTCNRSNLSVLKVTNLNDSGPGSFRQAIADVQNDRLSVIVFTVAGVIQLTSRIDVAKQCLYIAGQTAPGSGITISGDLFWRSTTRHIVMRYLRLAGGANHLIMASNGDFIIDHVSSRWAKNSLMSITHYKDVTWSNPVKNVTIQRSLFSEALAIHPVANIISSNDYWHPSSKSYNIDLHHNLYANNSHRNPLTNQGGAKVVNNVVYNWNQGVVHGAYRLVTDVIANYFKPGPRTDTKPYLWEVTYDCGSATGLTGYELPPTNAEGYASYYVTGNIGPHDATGTGNQFQGGANRMVACYGAATAFGGIGSPIPPGGDLHPNLAAFKTPNRLTPLPGPTHAYPIRIQTAGAAYESIVTAGDVGANARLDCDGSWVPNSDAVDRRVINDTRNRTGPNFIPAGPDDVGGWPAIVPGKACPDSNGDGIPDAFIARYGLDPKVNYATVLNGDGYTVLEAFLNGTSPR